MPSKTREQFKRTLERKPDMPKQGDGATLGRHADTTHPPHMPSARQSDARQPPRHEPGKPSA